MDHDCNYRTEAHILTDERDSFVSVAKDLHIALDNIVEHLECQSPYADCPVRDDMCIVCTVKHNANRALRKYLDLIRE